MARAEPADRPAGKGFSITGWRLGHSGSDARWAQLGSMNDLGYVCAPAPLQAGVGAGIGALAGFCFAKPDEELEEACRRIERLR